MNGLIIARALLLARPELMAALGAGAAGKVFVGVIPAGAQLPCLGLTEVVATEHLTLNGGATTLCFSTVQITAAAASLRQCKEVLAQARYACRNFVGAAAGAQGVTCRNDLTGPDFVHEAGFAMQTQDVRITFRDAP